MQGVNGDSCLKRNLYRILDVFYIVFGVLYMVGDADHFDITPLRFAKPIPLWLMIA